MPRRLTFATTRRPPPLKFWTPTRGQASIKWLPDDEFAALARKYGMKPNIGAFTVWNRGWWLPKLMVFRAGHMKRLILHEARHVEVGDFHPEEGE